MLNRLSKNKFRSLLRVPNTHNYSTWIWSSFLLDLFQVYWRALLPRTVQTSIPYPKTILTLGKFDNWKVLSSLHWSFSLSFCSFLYNGVCFVGLRLSVNDVIVSQKSSNGDGKLQFYEQDYKWTKGNILHCTKRIQNKTKTIQCRLLSWWN